MKVNMDKIRQYEDSRKNIIQIGEYIMMKSRHKRFGFRHHQDLDIKMLTPTLHHNIFTYLDYVFSATFILSDFIHIYFHIYIYIYIYIYKQV